MSQTSSVSTPEHPDPIERGLELVRARFAVVDRTLAACSGAPVRDYAASLFASPGRTVQDPADFVTAFGRRVEGLLGAEIARRAERQLAASPVVLTTNHHGLDTFAQSIQTNLLYALRGGDDLAVVPVAACANVPLNNLTYPRGVLLYALSRAAAARGVMRLPLFPDRFKRRMVNAVEPYTGEMLDRLRKRTRGADLAGSVAGSALRALDRVLLPEFESVLERRFRSYSEQASLLNARLWRHLFARPDSAPELVYVELESIATELLRADLSDPTSLAHALMFDRPVRERLLHQLDGVQGCWVAGVLQRRLLTEGGGAPGGGESGGSAWFWGNDADGRRVALWPVPGPAGSLVLAGVDEGGQRWSVPFTVEAVLAELAANRIQPSLFTAYMVLNLARGVTCIGGYYQAAYLPQMQAGVIDALGCSADSAVRSMAEGVAAAHTDGYLSGMQTVTARFDGQRMPAGIAEIVAAGGLTPTQLWSMGRVSVRDAHVASLNDTLLDACRGPELDRDLLAAITGSLESRPLRDTVDLTIDD